MSAKVELSKEQIINRAIGLIDLFENRLLAEHSDDVFPGAAGFDPELSAGICGIMHLSQDIRKELHSLIGKT